MIRKFVAATLMIALAALFYYTDHLEQDQATVTVKPNVRVPSNAPRASHTMSSLSSAN